ncbi:MBOAT family O-acyltransferase [Butyrivibrio fibrisolvens]|uniref:MBOAT family O-acyltransferase n=1 Tax=Butyrivibrio fibrisolvens TaxID=831 RepID=UPI0003F5328E|nr:MBOAT family O-acyltransferase [Butyrivibrio fibrisolvens]
MSFNSYIFILCLLPISFIGYFALSRKKQEYGLLWMAASSLVFYAWAGISILLLFIASLILNYIFTLFIKRNNSKLILALGIILNVILLIYFKYSGFLVQNINALFNTDFIFKNIALPLGISFFTFTQISWLVDTYRGETRDYSLLEYVLFISYFPKMAEGPIALHGDILPQFRDKSRKTIDYDNISCGIMIFVLGLFKKLMIADTLGKAVDWGFNNVLDLYSMDIWIVMLCYTLQIYFDFSGYCDMAAGVSLLFNIELPVNFNSPYKALSITDFWKRWHISLTSFLRKYVYFPLGGSRKGTVRTYINMMIVFIVSGIWHGANWTFILWGALHGACQVLHRIFRKPFDKIFAPVRWFITFLFVNIAWLLFRADSVAQWWYMVGKAFGIKYRTMHEELVSVFKIPRLRSVLSVAGIPYTDMGVYVFGMVLMLCVCMFICLVPRNNLERQHKTSVWTLALTFVLFMVCFLSLSNVTSFLYFNF